MDVLEKLGQIYLSQGLTVGKIAYEIAEDTGMNYWWVMTYLPDKIKARPDLTCHSKTLSLDKRKEKLPKSKVTSLATGDDMLQICKKKLTINNYSNIKSVKIVLEKRFYAKIEKIAEKLCAKPDIIINNTLLLTLKKLEDMVERSR